MVRNIRGNGPQRIDFFDEQDWNPGTIEKKVDQTLQEGPPKDEFYLSGRWTSALPPELVEKYKGTLGGRPLEDFDPQGYLAKLGITRTLTGGREDADLFSEYKLEKDCLPDPSSIPFDAEWKKKAVLKILPLIKKIAPKRLANWLQGRLVKMVMHMKEKADMEPSARDKVPPPEEHDPQEIEVIKGYGHMYGRYTDIKRGAPVDISAGARYAGITARLKPSQLAWAQGVHGGSIMSNRGENYGTYDIALRLGFTDSQARRISEECNSVDTDQTHYLDSKDPHRTRITRSGSGGDGGDYHCHFNRNPPGKEDTRLTAARIHMDRALRLANEKYYDAAERELGIGLHSLQDVFSHAQITPLGHVLMGVFPDLVKDHPLAMYESALATEAYLRTFIDQLKMPNPAERDRAKACLKNACQTIEGDAAVEDKAALGAQLARYPDALVTFLREHDISFYLGKPGTRPTDIGFGTDLDQDGRISPGKWVDVNQDGERQAFEVEGQLPDGTLWNDKPGAFDPAQRVIYISSEVLRDTEQADKVLRHEISHAVSQVFSEDPQLKDKWLAYLRQLFESSRRSGEVDFDFNPHEFFPK
jgi:hypothetical protein